MKVSAWLAIEKSPRYPYYNVRINKTQPNLKFNEVALKLNLELPDALFTKPRLEANISVPEGKVGAQIINADTIDNVAEAIKQHTGMEVRMWIEENKAE